MALVRSEFLRIRSRRLVWILALIAVLGMLVAVVLIARASHPPTAGALARQHALWERDIQRCNASGVAGPGTSDGSCRERLPLRGYMPAGTFGLVMVPEAFQHAATIFIVIGLVIGASSIGADWQSGAIGTLLTWEPRRVRIWVVRMLVVCASVFILTVALQIVLTVLLWLVAAARGSTAWLDGAWATELLGSGARVAAMASLGALLGLSVAMIGRTTGAALAGVFVYLAVFESLLRAIRPSSGTWLLGPNVVTFVIGYATSPGTSQTLTFAHAIGVITLYAAVLFSVSLLWFRLRDIGN